MNQWYGKGLNRFATGDIDWINDTVVGVLVNTTGYTINPTVDEFLSAIPLANRIAQATITGKTVRDFGILDAVDLTFPNLAAGKTAQAIVIVKDVSADPTQSPLLMYIDDGVDFPVITNGGSHTIRWSASGVGGL